MQVSCIEARVRRKHSSSSSSFRKNHTHKRKKTAVTNYYTRGVCVLAQIYDASNTIITHASNACINVCMPFCLNIKYRKYG